MIGDKDRPGGEMERERLRTVIELMSDVQGILDTLKLPALRYDCKVLRRTLELTLRYRCGVGR